ncbi:hypothetical protein AB0L64_10440 [Kribbella sp. NPDC051936]|uniref:8-oxoguanine DNA glycosylase n=1 Tax=Kribbella sp. NPDC051936 TaxID=3154946 RepID=UPI00343661CD
MSATVTGLSATICPSPDRKFQAGRADPGTDDVTLVGSGWARTFDWGQPAWLGSAAFWVEQTRIRPRPDTYQVGRTLIEETALCLLGGYGVSEPMAAAAFNAVRDAGLLSEIQTPTVAAIEAVLQIPLDVPGRRAPVRYRFPAQRARRLAGAVACIGQSEPSDCWSARELRSWLTQLPGVGLKTASWIVRNLRRSDDVAVIDIHIRRAGVFAGVFDPHWRLPRDYELFEEAFCAWARHGDVPTADMDACIWSSLAGLGNAARTLFGVERLADLD